MTPSKSVELEAAVERLTALRDQARNGTPVTDPNEWEADELDFILSALSASNARAVAAEEWLREQADKADGGAKQHTIGSQARAFEVGRAKAFRDVISHLASMKEKDRG